MRIGYFLSSEEHPPNTLVSNGRAAEQAGFDFLGISDHYFPWLHEQGNSPFVWSVIGGLAAVTARIPVVTAVTCPIMRMHPAIVAHASATAAAMLPGRFVFGVGTGERLNEHVTGDRWPPTAIRREMLTEALQIIRELWTGEMIRAHHGTYYEVELARLYTRPDEPPPVIVSAYGPRAAKLAAEIGDGLFTVGPAKEVVEAYREAGGDGPVYGKIDVCVADDEATARKRAHELWRFAALTGDLNLELAIPEHFEQACEMVTEEMVAESVVCSSDPDAHRERLQELADAGVDHVTVQQIGPEQDRMIEFYAESVLASARASA